MSTKMVTKSWVIEARSGSLNSLAELEGITMVIILFNAASLERCKYN